MTIFTGTSGNDSFVGTSAADTFNLQQGGDDTATGHGGKDRFNMGATLNAADKIDGGAGKDTVALDGDYSAGVNFNATTMVNVETLLLAAGHNYRLAIHDATVAAGAKLTVDGSALGVADSLIFDGRRERDGSLVLIGGAGSDVLFGGDYLANAGVTNTFNLRHGGDDRVTGGYNAKNVVNFGATFTASDQVLGNSGPAGTMTIVLDGDYTGARAVTMNATTMQNVDTLRVSAGHSYTLVGGNAALGHGGHTLIDGGKLGASEVLRFDGSTQTAGVFDFIGGAGDDVLIGSSSGEGDLGGTFDLSKGGNDMSVGGVNIDTFKFGAAFTAADRVDGGGSFENFNFGDTVELDGNYAGAHAVTFGAKTMVNVERLTVAAGHSYTLATNDATVAVGRALLVDGSALGSGRVLTFDGGAESDGTFSIRAGAGNDVLTGGAGNDFFDLHRGGSDTARGGGGADFFDLGSKLNAADAIDGGAGNDTVRLDGDYSAGVTFSPTTLRHIEELILGTGHSYKFKTADGTVTAGATLAVDASALATGNNLNFDGRAETDGSFVVTAGAGRDTIRGGAGNDSVDFGTHFNANDFFNGGAGNDTLMIDKANAANMVLSNVKNIEMLDLGGDSYHITTTDGVVSAGAQLFVEFGGFNNGHTLWFDGSAETNGSFGLAGGTSDDHLVGGARSDGIGGGDGADFLQGGGGHDNYFYDAVSDSTSTEFDTISGFDANGNDLLVLSGGHVQAIDATIAHGSLSDATFDSDLGGAVDAAHLAAHDAVLFAPDAGSHAGQTFLIIDANAQAGYQADADYVIRLQNPAHIGQLSTNSFASF